MVVLTYQKHLPLAPSLSLPVVSSLLTSLPVVLQEWALAAVTTVSQNYDTGFEEDKMLRSQSERRLTFSCRSCCFFFSRFSFSLIFSINFFFSETFVSANSNTGNVYMQTLNAQHCIDRFVTVYWEICYMTTYLFLSSLLFSPHFHPHHPNCPVKRC